MTEAEYGIRKATPSLPSRDLLSVPHKNGVLIVSYPTFGPNTYSGNIGEMEQRYSHSKDLPNMSFRALTTSESISAAAYDFENMAKPNIFDPRWLQLGRVLRTKEGVWANLPTDAQGKLVTDESVLKQSLIKAQKIKVGDGHIYLAGNDFGFAEYETFERGVQDCDTFAQGGLARVLEPTQEKVAKNLRAIASPKLYKRGVNVWGFDPVNEPALRVASLLSYRGIVGGRLSVDGDDWDGDDGCAFGGLVSGEASSQKN